MLPFDQESNKEAIMSWTVFGGQGAVRNQTKRSLSIHCRRRASRPVIGSFSRSPKTYEKMTLSANPSPLWLLPTERPIHPVGFALPGDR